MFTCVALSPSSLSDCAERERQRLEQTPLAASLQGRARSTEHENISRLVRMPTKNRSRTRTRSATVHNNVLVEQSINFAVRVTNLNIRRTQVSQSSLEKKNSKYRNKYKNFLSVLPCCGFSLLGGGALFLRKQ